MGSHSVRPSSSRCTSLSSKSDKKAKARGGKQQSLPGLEPSPAWEKMKSTPKRLTVPEKVHRQDEGPGHPSWRNAVVPGKCTCGDRIFEDKGNPGGLGHKENPWMLGHAYWCSMWMEKCAWCGQTGGTHKHGCQFWK